MKKLMILLSVAATILLPTASEASIVTLSGTRTGPILVTLGGGLMPVSNGLIRLGTFTGLPASGALADIDAVFAEFAVGATAADGRVGQTFNNASAAPFNGQQIYIWAFNGSSMASATQHGVFTVADPNSPDAGNPWLFPTHTGSGTDSATVSLSALLTGLDSSITPGVSTSSANGGQLILFVPEPSSALLGLSGLLLAFRRRR